MNVIVPTPLQRAILVVATLTTTLTSVAQGTIHFTNIRTPGQPRVFLCDAETRGLTPIQGSNYLINLVAQNPATGNWEGVLKNDGSPFMGVAPLTGANAGLFTGGILTIPFLYPGSMADVEIRAWDVTTGATYESSFFKSSVRFTVESLGGAGTPPSLPAVLANMPPFAVCPELSTYALGGLGLGLIVLHSHRTSRRKG